MVTLNDVNQMNAPNKPDRAYSILHQPLHSFDDPQKANKHTQLHTARSSCSNKLTLEYLLYTDRNTPKSPHISSSPTHSSLPDLASPPSSNHRLRPTTSAKSGSPQPWGSLTTSTSTRTKSLDANPAKPTSHPMTPSFLVYNSFPPFLSLTSPLPAYTSHSTKNTPLT